MQRSSVGVLNPFEWHHPRRPASDEPAVGALAAVAANVTPYLTRHSPESHPKSFLQSLSWRG